MYCCVFIESFKMLDVLMQRCQYYLIEGLIVLIMGFDVHSLFVIQNLIQILPILFTSEQAIFGCVVVWVFSCVR